MSTVEEKWRFLRESPGGDAMHARIQQLSDSLMNAAGGNIFRYLTLAHTVARDWIRQTSDTDRIGGEDIAGYTREPAPDDAVDALNRGYDDCDAKARLFVALCLAKRIKARIVPYWTQPMGGPPQPWKHSPGADLAHVAAEVLWKDGKWAPVELTLSRARLGELGIEVPKEKDGKWKLT